MVFPAFYHIFDRVSVHQEENLNLKFVCVSETGSKEKVIGEKYQLQQFFHNIFTPGILVYFGIAKQSANRLYRRWR